jgi:hypothetical protein
MIVARTWRPIRPNIDVHETIINAIELCNRLKALASNNQKVHRLEYSGRRLRGPVEKEILSEKWGLDLVEFDKDF